ncbi:MAG TPA: hypothetical protein VIE43_04000 [Thermoanaerobaculia bacterium]|jgi:hypothetical protein|nr:hypothetical protein [Thermoanaerobaculia bacterium]
MEIFRWIGIILGLIGGLWLLVTAFRVSILWGVVCLIPFGALLFAVTHWEDAKEPFLTSLVGTLIIAFAR